MTDKLYTEMCKQAHEIQEAWGCKNYDERRLDIYSTDGKVTHVSPFSEKNWNAIEDNAIWLPSQEDLQGMVRVGESDVAIHFRFDKWIKKEWIYDRGLGGFPAEWIAPFNNNYPEMWLAFVMHELYQKKWDGKEWK